MDVSREDEDLYAIRALEALVSRELILAAFLAGHLIASLADRREFMLETALRQAIFRQHRPRIKWSGMRGDENLAA